MTDPEDVGASQLEAETETPHGLREHWRALLMGLVIGVPWGWLYGAAHASRGLAVAFVPVFVGIAVFLFLVLLLIGAATKRYSPRVTAFAELGAFFLGLFVASGMGPPI